MMNKVNEFPVMYKDHDNVFVFCDMPIFTISALRDWSLMNVDTDSYDNPVIILKKFNEFMESALRLDQASGSSVSIQRDANAAVENVHELNKMIARVDAYVEVVNDYISNREYINGPIPDTGNMYQVVRRLKRTFDFCAACTTELYRNGYFEAA